MHTETRDGVLCLHGAVTMATVTATQHRQFCQAVSTADVHTVDLAGVSRGDSACVALLLAAAQIKKQQQSQIAFAQMPADLRMLIALYEIDAWIKS